MDGSQTHEQLRKGVRAGILVSLRRDFDMRGGRTARLLALAGLGGVAGAVGATLLMAGHPFGHHAPWHVAAFSAVWAGLLVVMLAIALLQVRTPSLPLARSASVGLTCLGIAGACGVLCPDPHFLGWWSATRVGGYLAMSGGLACTALCFGLISTTFFGAAAAFIALGTVRAAPIQPYLPAAMVFLLLLPGVALQSVGTSWTVFGGWLLGTAIGAIGGVTAGFSLRSVLAR